MITVTDMTGLPSIPFLTVNGAIFGLLPGLLISWVGEVLGTELSFVIMRTILRRQAIHVISRHHLRNQLDKYSRFPTLAVARSIPYIQCSFTAIAAVSHISQKDHFLATAVGKVPRVVIEVLLGHDLIHISQHSGRLFFLGYPDRLDLLLLVPPSASLAAKEDHDDAAQGRHGDDGRFEQGLRRQVSEFRPDIGTKIIIKNFPQYMI